MAIERFSVLLDDQPCTIEIDPAGAIPWLAHWLAFFPRTATARPVIRVVHKPDDRIELRTRAGAAVCAPTDIEALLDQNLRALLRYAGSRPLLHGALIGDGAHAIIVTGPSGVGKTTIVREAVRTGLAYWTDEYIVAARQGVLGHPRCLELDDDTGRTLRRWSYSLGPNSTATFGHLIGLLPPRWLPWRSVVAIVHLSNHFDAPVALRRSRPRRPDWHRPAHRDLWPTMLQLGRRPHYILSGGTARQRVQVIDRLLTGPL